MVRSVIGMFAPVSIQSQGRGQRQKPVMTCTENSLHQFWWAMPTLQLFAEGFGVVGGAIGTWVGGELIGTGIASALCLGPMGAFVLAGRVRPPSKSSNLH
jgi:hypothetical protein